jgi:2-methylcitrate dehydratase
MKLGFIGTGKIASAVITGICTSKIEDQLGIADAHPNGKRPFKRENYINKFKTLTANIIDQKESERFLEDVQNLKEINKSELHKLNVEVVSDLQKQRSSKNSIF